MWLRHTKQSKNEPNTIPLNLFRSDQKKNNLKREMTLKPPIRMFSNLFNLSLVFNLSLFNLSLQNYQSIAYISTGFKIFTIIILSFFFYCRSFFALLRSNFPQAVKLFFFFYDDKVLY